MNEPFLAGWLAGAVTGFLCGAFLAGITVFPIARPSEPAPRETRDAEPDPADWWKTGGTPP